MIKCEECGKPAKYKIYKTFPDGHKEFISVCRKCERKIGDDNMKRAGGRYKR